jgi:hypothetical protein
MTEADAIGPDGTMRLRLRRYMLMANAVWFSGGCGNQAYRSCCGP